MTYDIAVVGGGPAGSTAARAALETDESLDVVLLEAGVPREERDEKGPDSTDAAGLLDYWRDLAALDDELVGGYVQQSISQVDFYSPNEYHRVTKSGTSSAYDSVAFTFDRTGLDDHFLDLAIDAGVEYRPETRVADVETTFTPSGPRHRLSIPRGDSITAERLILADGPKRRATLSALSQFYPRERLRDRLGPATANHVAYQEHREAPPEVMDEFADRLVFWWANVPGETAYTWLFPGEETVRVGLTMPTGLTWSDVDRPTSHPLVRESDDSLPSKATFLRRQLEETFGDEYDVESDFPLVDDRGKTEGTEGYQISSTHPIESPVGAGIAVTGGAMGATSAFHEGGYHMAVSTGRLAGELAAERELDAYNDRWKANLGEEIHLNLTLTEALGDHSPEEWDETFALGGAVFSLIAADPLKKVRILGSCLTNPAFRGRIGAFLKARSAYTSGGLAASAVRGLLGDGPSYEFTAIEETDYEYGESAAK